MSVLLRRTALILLILTGAYFLAAPFVVPWLLGREVRQAADETLNGSLSYRHIAFNPVTLLLTVRDVKLLDAAGRPAVNLPTVRLKLSWRSLWAQEILISRLLLERPDVRLAIDEDGKTSLEALVKPTGGADGGAKVHIGELTAQGLSVGIHNHNGHTLDLGPLDLTLKDFATHEGHPVGLERFDFDLGAGRVSAVGTHDRQEGRTEIDLLLSNVPVTAIAGFIPLGDIAPEAGHVTGQVVLTLDDNFTVSADAKIGGLGVKVGSGLLRRIEVPFVDVGGFRFDRATNQIDLALLQLTSGHGFLLREKAAEKIDGDVEDANPDIAVRDLRVHASSLTFEDRTFSPTAVTDISSLDAMLTDFSLGDTIVVGGQVDASTGPNSNLVVAGFMELADELSATVTVQAERLDHALLSPYLNRSLGRPTEAGYAYLNMDYYIAAGEIEGSNQLLFDRWKWGDKDPAFEGEDIPLKKAFNLLERKGGRVELDIPVEGELLDPTFRVEKLVRRATGKAIEKIITAPFRLLGKLIPGGKDDLDYDKVNFEPLSAELGALEKAHLHALSTALKERPNLKLRIDGKAAEDEGGDARSLLKLATMRADAVYRFLLIDGIEPTRLVKTVLPSFDVAKGKKPRVKLDIVKD